MSRRSVPEVNAGSMADIAFLLLIFFLVTTTIEIDAGIDRKLPPLEQIDQEIVIKKRNILEVVVNKNNQLLVEEKLVPLKDLRKVAMEFLDNGGGTGEDACDYCRGKKDPESSDNPHTAAVISLQNDRETSYKTYIAVQNELVGAYNELRNREAQRLYRRDYTIMEAEFKDPRTSQAMKDRLKPELERIQNMYPQKISEAEPKSN
jgi:biopolymer transport protein ExbD